jgi:hypothetical protein
VVATPAHPGMTPRQKVEQECARHGKAAVVARCVRLVEGGDVEADLLVALGGPGARKFLDGGAHADTYWLRVWGARGLLWAWDSSATEAIRIALRDDAWRVREMGAKVVARHQVDDALESVAVLVDDPVPRVRAAATRALVRLTGSS